MPDGEVKAVTTKKKFAASSIRRYYVVLQSILHSASKLGLIASNPADSDKIDLPPLEPPETQIFTKEEAAAMLGYLSNEPLMYQVLINLAIITGCRRGELVALEWSDIDFKADTVSISKSNSEATGRALLQKMDLSDKADAYPCQLSGGQQQRVSIARALAMNPDILFFDEPTSALDPELTGEILKVIRELAAEHMTMVVVTHEMKFARDVADYVVFMDNGAIVEQGSPEQLFGNTQNERTRSFLSRFNEK